MLTDVPAKKNKSPKRRAVAAGSNYQWSDKQKIEAVQSYLTLGNLALTGRILGIPEITLRVWKTSEWWKNTVEDIKQSDTIQLSSRLKKIVEASLSAVEDRLQNGDFIYDNKTQQMVRKQVNLRDAHKVAVDLMDKKAVLEKSVVAPEQEQTDEQRLLRLAEKFADMVNKKKEKVVLEDITDVEIKQDNSEAESKAHNLEVLGSNPSPATNTGN